jgi:hypothetical protein
VIVPRWTAIALLLLVGCGSGKPTLDTGRGLYWSWTPARLQSDGYPGSSPEKYSSLEWGVLYDDEGIPYGPKSYFDGRTRLEHPYFEVTDAFMQSRWVRIGLSDCCTEPLIGHFLEICDLAWMDITTQLGYRPDARINVFSPPNLDAYYLATGADFARTFVTTSNMVVIQPIDVLFRRTLAGHAAYAGIGEAIIEMQTNGTAPVWLRTGLASYLAQEGFEHLSFMAEFRPQRDSILLTPAQVIEDLVPLNERQTARVARYNAFLMAWHLSEHHGFDRIVQLLDHMGAGMTVAQAVEATYGVDEATLLAAIDPTVLGEPTTTVPGRQAPGVSP